MKTAEQVRKYIEERKSKKKGGSKKDWVSFPKGTYYIRVGPPWRKKGEVWKDVLFHGYWKDKVYCARNDVDPETGKQGKCPVCRRVAELKGDRSKKGKKLWSLISQRSEGLWNVLVCKLDDNKKPIPGRYADKKFKILRLSYKWHLALVDHFSDDDYRSKSILGITHPKYGRLLKLRREGEGRDDTNYTFTVKDKETPISKNQSKREALLATLVDLDKAVYGSSSEELEAFLRTKEKEAKKLSREEDEDDEEEDDDVDEDDEKPRHKKSKKSDDDEDEEEEEDEESDDDDEEDDLKKQYKKMKKGLKKKSREEDDDDEEEDEEDDE